MTGMNGQASKAAAVTGKPPASNSGPRYRTYEALSELVDNSIDARGRDGVGIQITLDYAAKSIRVSDDGVGMNRDELRGAVAAAGDAAGPQQRRPGAPGLGMKAACLFLGRSFSVSTSRAGSAQEYAVECDGERLEGGKAGARSLPFTERKKDDPAGHGTSILVTGLRVPLYAEQTTLFKKRLGERCCGYIEEGQARIRVNSVECRPIQADVAEGSVRRFELDVPSGKAAGWVGLPGSRRAAGGFGVDLYRRGRLVKMRSRFGARGGLGAAKIVGRISLDNVPVNPRGTGFDEESAEYLEAERAFGEHPAVEETVRNRARGIGARGIDFGHFYDYLLGRRDDPARMAPRLGREASRALLDSMPRLDTEVGGRAVTMEYADAGGPPYERHEEANGGVRYVINKGSPVFAAVKNPLYVVALAAADLRAAAAAEPGKGLPASGGLNAAWASMVDGLARGKAARPPPDPASNGYSLSRNLTKLLSVLEDCYFSKFEFTGLSTLARYTHNALASPAYSLYTEREHGEYLCDVIMDFATGYVPLFNPDGRDMDMWRYASGDKTLVVVREYSAGEISGPVAPPAKAWMDLVREVRLHHMPYMEEDLVAILDTLKYERMLALRDLEAIARRRKSGHARDLIEKVFGA